LNAKNLPGRPDIVFPGRMKAIFVHGCFWHSHGCRKGQAPKSRLDYWEPKLKANKKRDRAQIRALRSLGWAVLTLWQCETTDPETMRVKVVDFMERASNQPVRSVKIS
jgi:DNA mismatch endonuclease, patch repair protein